jgi:hypothetical protein
MSPITDRHKIKVTDFGILVRIRWHIQWICHQRCAAAAQAARASVMMSLAFSNHFSMFFRSARSL